VAFSVIALSMPMMGCRKCPPARLPPVDVPVDVAHNHSHKVESCTPFALATIS
jgi:hypothetical protein